MKFGVLLELGVIFCQKLIFFLNALEHADVFLGRNLTLADAGFDHGFGLGAVFHDRTEIWIGHGTLGSHFLELLKALDIPLFTITDTIQ